MGKKAAVNGTGKSNVLDFNALVNAGSPKLTRIHIEELGGDVYLKGMSALDVIEFATSRGAAGEDRDAQHQAMTDLIAKAVVDENGDEMFDTAEKKRTLRGLDFRIFTALASAVTDNAGLTDKEKKDAAVEGEVPVGKD